MTAAVDALLALPGAERGRLYSPSFRRCLDVLDHYATPDDLTTLAAVVLSLCVTLDEARAEMIRLHAQQLRPIVVCADPTRCPKGDPE